MMKFVEEQTLPYWPAPYADGPVTGEVTVPGSKSLTNRALILAALADTPSVIVGALHSRDTSLMMAALQELGTDIRGEGGTITVTPHPLHGGNVDCGLAGTVMRFVPPVAATARGTVIFDGDPQARTRPMSTILNALRELGVSVEGERLPCSVHGDGSPTGGTVRIDASASSQFISGLLLAGARFRKGIQIQHSGGPLPSTPHIDMTVDMLRTAGVKVHSSGENSWTVEPGTISGRTWTIEPDLSNATPFLAAAAVTGGSARVRHWPAHTTQPGDSIREILSQMGCDVELTEDLVVSGPPRGQLHGITISMADIGELTPTVAALAAVASTESRITGIAHLRGHETDRLAALSREITRLGGKCEELSDGLHIQPVPLHGGLWHSYADHRMATAGAILGLVVPGVEVEDIATTSKTLPGFAEMWTELVHHG